MSNVIGMPLIALSLPNPWDVYCGTCGHPVKVRAAHTAEPTAAPAHGQAQWGRVGDNPTTVMPSRRLASAPVLSGTFLAIAWGAGLYRDLVAHAMARGVTGRRRPRPRRDYGGPGSGAMWDGSRSAWWESARPAGGSAATGSGDMRIRVANRRRRVLCGLHRRPLLPRPRPATAPSRPSHCRPARRVSCLLRVGLVIGACPPFVSTGTAAGFGHPGPEPGWVEPRAGRCLAPPGGELGLYSTQVRGPDPLSYAFSQLGSML